MLEDFGFNVLRTKNRTFSESYFQKAWFSTARVIEPLQLVLLSIIFAGNFRRKIKFGVPYGSRTRVAAVTERRFIVIQGNFAGMDSTLPHFKTAATSWIKGAPSCV